MATAETHFVGSLHTGNEPALHVKRDVAKDLSRCYPWAGPLNTILINLRGGTVQAQRPKHEWEIKHPMPHHDTTKQNSTAGAVASEIKTRVNNDPQWQLHDIVNLLDDSAYAYDLVVVNVGSNGGDVELTLKAFTDGSYPNAPASIPSGSRLLRVGVAFPEESGDFAARGTYPGNEYNYAQIHFGGASISGTKMASQTYTNDDWAEAKQDTLWRYRLDLDSAFCLGKRSKNDFTDPTTGEVRTRRTMQGLDSFVVTNRFTYVIGALTEATLMDWAKTVFAENNGSKDRVLFADKELQAEIDQIPFSNSTGEVRSNRSLMDGMVKLGLKVRDIVTTFGNLYLVYNPSFNYRQKDYYGQIVDLKDLKRVVLRPMYTLRRTEVNTGVDGEQLRLREESTLRVGCEEYHAIIQGVVS